MEQQIDTNITEPAVYKKETSFWNRPSTRVFILIGIILLIFLYETVLVPRQECSTKISYRPATQSVGDGGFGTIQGKSEYYSYTLRDFKTREEAISYCLSVR